MKKALSMILAAVLLLSVFTVLPLTVYAVEADNVAFIGDEPIRSVYAVGDGQDSWLNGCVWDVSASENRMTEVDPGVYEITFKDVCDGWYQFKFAANGSWDVNWGSEDDDTITLDTTLQAKFNGSNICFDLDEESDVTLRLDLRSYNSKTKEGAEFTVTAMPVDSPTIIDTVKVTITEPKPGKEPDYKAVVTKGKGYAVDSEGGVMWFNVSNDDEYIAPGSGYVFEPNKEYRVMITLVTTDDAYTFAPTGRKGTLNDMEVGFSDYGWNEERMVYVECYFVCAPAGGAAIREVEVETDEPEVGNYPYYYAFVDSDRYRISGGEDDSDQYISGGIGWYNVTDDRAMSYTDTFEEGKVYQWSVRLKANEFPFAPAAEISAKLNGKTAYVRRVTDQSILVWYDFIMPGSNAGSGLTITSKSNFFGNQTVSYTDGVPSQVTVEYYCDTDKYQFINGQYGVNYDSKVLRLNEKSNKNDRGRLTVFPITGNGGIFNFNAFSFNAKGNFSYLEGCDLTDETGAPIPVVRLVFDVVGRGSTEVELFVEVQSCASCDRTSIYEYSSYYEESMSYYNGNNGFSDMRNNLANDGAKIYTVFLPEGESAGGSTVSGSFTSYLDASDTVTVQLLQDGSEKYSATATGNTGSYSISDVADGSYTLRVSKKNHVTRDYAITVSGSTAQDVKINPKGDVDGNGKVQAADAMKAYQHAQGKADAQLSDYAFLCADVAPVGSPNGKVQAADAMVIYQQAQGKHPLF